MVATAELATNGSAETALGILERRSTTLTLQALTHAETEELLKSVFGDVPGLSVVSDGIHRISGGNPRACMDLAQHLVDSGRVLYDAGTWTLPKSLDATDLPQSAEAAIQARIEHLSPLARLIAEAQAMAICGAFTRQSYALLYPDETTSRVDHAIAELLSQQLLTSDGRVHALSHEGWASALRLPLSAVEKVERHRALVRLYESDQGLGIIHHLLRAGAHAVALERLQELLTKAVDGFGLSELSQMNAITMSPILEDALRASVSLGQSPRAINELRRWVTALAPSADEGFHDRNSPAWLLRLKRDSGLDTWNELSTIEDPSERRARALGAAYEAYGRTPESERVYAPDEAIKGLVQYVVFSIAVGSRAYDSSLIRSLPPLLEPFVPLSPAVEAIWNNAVATADLICDGRPEAARERWTRVHERLEGMTEEQLPYVGAIRRAIESGIGNASAQMGLASASEWAERLEKDPLHDINALYLRRAVRLQLGDWTGAEQFRRRAELLDFRATSRQMFQSSLILELSAYAMARDLTGLKQTMDRIEPLAARAAGWLAFLRLAEGSFHFICGQHERALVAFDAALALAAPAPGSSDRMLSAYPAAAAGRAEALIELGRVAEAKDGAAHALAACSELGISVLSHHVARALALAEANAGDYAAGSARLEGVIREQTELGVTGLHLGATYEARARIAIWAADTRATEHFGRLTALEYRHGQGSPLAARYQRLLDEAHTSIAEGLPKLWQLEATRAEEAKSARGSITSVVSRTLEGAASAGERAARVLRLLCGGRASVEAHLFLSSNAGLALAASQEAADAPEGLLDYLTDYLSRELHSGDVETAMVEDLPSQFMDALKPFQDERGRRYTLVPLTALVDGTVRYAGVAALIEGDARDHKIDAGLASALGTHLIEVGDTMGIAASG